ncbi:hypothetical protein [Lacrimispora sp.]|nr:hypothetical protein [Lacrimispora sp.]
MNAILKRCRKALLDTASTVRYQELCREHWSTVIISCSFMETLRILL